MFLLQDKIKSNLLLALELYFRRFDKKHQLFEWRKAHCLKLQQASSNNNECTSTEIPSIQAAEVTPEFVSEKTHNFRRPLVIRGLMKEAIASQKWSSEYFIANYGESSYPMVADTRKQEPTTRKYDFETITIKELIESIQAGLTFRYLANLSQVFVDHPDLMHEMELNRLSALLGEQQTDECFELLSIFMGGLGTGSVIHCAFAGNFFYNIVGRKEWLLIDPAYSIYLLPMPYQPFLYAHAYFDPDDEKLGEFTRRLPSYNVVLEPGDVLYNAPWWWHRVRNLDQFTIGCAVRKSNLIADFANNPMFTLMSKEFKIYLAKYVFILKKILTKDKTIFRDILHRNLEKEIL